MKPPPAFDAYAAGYDRHFTDSAIGRAQRRLVWRGLLPLLGGKMDILEINCGTGEDAMRLAGLGHNVLATDLSGEMIRIAEAKRKTAPPLPGLQFRRAGFLELPLILKGRHFHLIFSNFGGLNCISPAENRHLAVCFHEILQPGGLLFLVYMSRRCTWERLYFSLKGEPQSAFRRRHQGPAKALVGENEMEVWYYSPEEVAELYAPFFRRQGLFPVGLFTPPSYLGPLFARRRKWLAALENLDAILSLSSLADHADHFAAILKKTD